MDALQFPLDQSVAESLQQGKSVAKVFIRNQTACVGCYLARFCSLRDVARIYELNPEEFQRELQQAVQTEIPSR